jgi:hypothetical protein
MGKKEGKKRGRDVSHQVSESSENIKKTHASSEMTQKSHKKIDGKNR